MHNPSTYRNKNETTTQNYRRLGLVSRLRAPTGGSELHRKTAPAATAAAATATTPAAKKGSKDPFAIHGTQSATAVTAEVKVERDENGRIVRVISGERKKFNPLNDPLVELDTDSEDAESNEDAEEWGGFEGETEQNEIIRQLEGEANRPVEKKPRTLSPREIEWLQSLVDRHGDNTAAMARDRKLNPMQQTAAEIARRIRKWKESSK